MKGGWCAPGGLPGGRGAPGGGKGGKGGKAGELGYTHRDPFIGTVKLFNQEKGWGMISCDRIQLLYGKDAFFLKSSLPVGAIAAGEQVCFYVRDELKGPVAVDIQQLPWSAGGLYSGVVPYAGGLGQFGMKGGGFVGPMMNLAMLQRIPSTNQTYFGSVVSFNEEKGWGFIKCDATKKFFNKDVFLMRSTLKGRTVKADDIVSFKVEMGIKGPQATELTIPPHGSIGFEGERGCTFSGTIKNFNTEKGFGFIEGVMVREVFGKDIFVHKRELGEHTPSPGDVVCFSVELDNNGQPQAKYVSFGTVPSHPFGLAPAGEAAAEPPSGAAAATEL